MLPLNYFKFFAQGVPLFNHIVKTLLNWVIWHPQVFKRVHIQVNQLDSIHILQLLQRLPLLPRNLLNQLLLLPQQLIHLHQLASHEPNLLPQRLQGHLSSAWWWHHRWHFLHLYIQLVLRRLWAGTCIYLVLQRFISLQLALELWNQFLALVKFHLLCRLIQLVRGFYVFGFLAKEQRWECLLIVIRCDCANYCSWCIARDRFLENPR